MNIHIIYIYIYIFIYIYIYIFICIKWLFICHNFTISVIDPNITPQVKPICLELIFAANSPIALGQL